MTKVAMQSLLNCAQEPGEVLRGLNRILTNQQRGKLTSAAYLWLDLKTSKGLYSAAVQRPLLRWPNGEPEHIESNGSRLEFYPTPNCRFGTAWTTACRQPIADSADRTTGMPRPAATASQGVAKRKDTR
jgi:hypothetical protein